jgi:hypothetical protein
VLILHLTWWAVRLLGAAVKLWASGALPSVAAGVRWCSGSVWPLAPAVLGEGSAVAWCGVEGDLGALSPRPPLFEVGYMAALVALP